MYMVDDLSNDPAHKLQAVITSYSRDGDENLPATYIDACRRWYAGLSGSERVVAILAAATFKKGDEAEAERAVAALPAAPVCPLL